MHSITYIVQEIKLSDKQIVLSCTLYPCFIVEIDSETYPILNIWGLLGVVLSKKRVVKIGRTRFVLDEYSRTTINTGLPT